MKRYMISVSQLPIDIINHILTYDKRFIVRRGQPISIIPKDDERYRILHTVTRIIPRTPNNYSDGKLINGFYDKSRFYYRYWIGHESGIETDTMSVYINENKWSVMYSIRIMRRITAPDGVGHSIKHFLINKCLDNRMLRIPSLRKRR
jgi:hypothetical protein